MLSQIRNLFRVTSKHKNDFNFIVLLTTHVRMDDEIKSVGLSEDPYKDIRCDYLMHIIQIKMDMSIIQIIADYSEISRVHVWGEDYPPYQNTGLIIEQLSGVFICINKCNSTMIRKVLPNFSKYIDDSMRQKFLFSAIMTNCAETVDVVLDVLYQKSMLFKKIPGYYQHPNPIPKQLNGYKNIILCGVHLDQFYQGSVEITRYNNYTNNVAYFVTSPLGQAMCHDNTQIFEMVLNRASDIQTIFNFYVMIRLNDKRRFNKQIKMIEQLFIKYSVWIETNN